MVCSHAVLHAVLQHETLLDGVRRLHCRQRQRRLEKGQVNKAGREPPLTADLPLTALGVASEAFQDALAAYVRANPEGTLHSASSTPKKVCIAILHIFSSVHESSSCSKTAMKLMELASLKALQLHPAHFWPVDAFDMRGLFFGPVYLPGQVTPHHLGPVSIRLVPVLRGKRRRRHRQVRRANWRRAHQRASRS